MNDTLEKTGITPAHTDTFVTDDVYFVAICTEFNSDRCRVNFGSGDLPSRAMALSWIEGIKKFYDYYPDSAIDAYNEKVRRENDAESAALRQVNQLPRARAGAPGYVYLAQSTHGLYKIGRSETPEHRIGTLGVLLPFEITPEHFIRCQDAVYAERMLHERFAHRRQRGEWFRLIPSDVAYIKAIARLDQRGLPNE